MRLAHALDGSSALVTSVMRMCNLVSVSLVSSDDSRYGSAECVHVLCSLVCCVLVSVTVCSRQRENTDARFWQPSSGAKEFDRGVSAWAGHGECHSAVRRRGRGDADAV